MTVALYEAKSVPCIHFHSEFPLDRISPGLSVKVTAVWVLDFVIDPIGEPQDAGGVPHPPAGFPS